MKKVSISLLALAAAFAVSSPAHADTTPGWYAGAGVGAAFPIDPTVRSAGGKVKAQNEDTNIDGLASVGYAWANGLRVEAEFFHNQVNSDELSGFGRGFGHVTNDALFANVFYDFRTGTMLTPYVGAGIGPDFVNVKNFGAPGYGFLDGDAVTAAYQGIVGVAAQLDRNWALSADYRYIESFDPKVNYSGAGEGRVDNASHNVVVSVRYSFGAPEYVAPAPTVRTAEAPMVAPAPTRQIAAPAAEQTFTVFFDFNKATIGPEAKKIIASAVQQFKKDGLAKITVTGHTDTVGSTAYNKKLSERRAAAVEEEIRKLGISTQNITKTGVGEEGLMIPTTDGVREAQNRRAEIVLTK